VIFWVHKEVSLRLLSAITRLASPSRQLCYATLSWPLRHEATVEMAYQDYGYSAYPTDGNNDDWSHRDSVASELSYDGRPQLRGRASLVSLDSTYHAHQDAYQDRGLASVPEEAEHVYDRPPSSRWPPYQPTGSGYMPVSAPATVFPETERGYFEGSQGRLVEDESCDMSLLRSAAPLGVLDHDAPAQQPVEAVEPAFDLTSFSGPIGAQDREFIMKLQEAEASGKLTGGLGTGMSPDTTITSNDLLATSPTIKRNFSISRALSVRRDTSYKGADIRDAGQYAANKSGEVVEVILDNPSEVDLSSMAGPRASDPDFHQMRRSTFQGPNRSTEVFYPQPNWKPFSMRWPYLLSLVILSLGLAVGQELLCQQAAKQPLLTFTSPDQLKPWDYFCLRFIPTIITVLFGVLWSITDVEVKRLEAFYQMSKKGGALAAESINVDYITLVNFSRPFHALQRKHYTVAISAVTSLLAVSLVPTLGSAAIVLNPNKETRHADPSILKTITIHPVLSRLLSATFVIIAILGMILFYQLHTRRSGLLADVKGIAGLASMAVVSHIMMDFKDMDTATPKDIHYKLRDHRYVLRNSSLAPDEGSPMTTQERDRYREAHLPENPHPLMLRPAGSIPFIVGILLFLGFILLFLFIGASELTDRAPWVVTALAVCIKLGWGSVDTNIRMMEPYYILSRRHAPARTLTLDYTAEPFGWVAVRALLNRHWLVFLVGFGTVLSETLTIFVTSLATVEGKDFIDQVRLRNGDGSNNGGGGGGFGTGQETVRSFAVSLVFTAFILLYMFGVATAVFLRRRHAFLPRQPNTIASVLAFMHQSKMLYDFVGTAKLSNAQMARRLDGLGKTYGLGIFEGRDGLTHCGVDEEELTGSYKHGVDYSQGNKPWDREWQLF
jgi:hypothetical protein